MSTKVENLAAALQLRETLADIATRYPRLVSPTAPSTVAEWEGVLKPEETRQTAFRLPVSLIDRLDGYCANTAKRTGIQVSRTDVVRALITLGLDLLDEVDGDPDLPPDPAVVRELVALAMDGVRAARDRGAA